MIDSFNDFIDEISLAFRKIVGLVFKVEGVKQQSGERILHLVSNLGRSASEGGDSFLGYQPVVSFNEFGSALSDARLEFFSVKFDLLLEPAFLIGQALLLRCARNGLEQYVFDNRFRDEIIGARAHDLRHNRKVRFTRDHYDREINVGATELL